MGSNVKQSTKNKVLTNQQFKCGRCRKSLDLTRTNFDHIIPQSKGGSDDPSNIMALCMDCHGGKTAEDRLRDNHEKKKEHRGENKNNTNKSSLYFSPKLKEGSSIQKPDWMT